MSGHDEQGQAHERCPACSRVPQDPARHPAFVAWFANVQQALAGGADPDSIKDFAGDDVVRFRVAASTGKGEVS
jgi:hypothetical protein